MRLLAARAERVVEKLLFYVANVSDVPSDLLEPRLLRVAVCFYSFSNVRVRASYTTFSSVPAGTGDCARPDGRLLLFRVSLPKSRGPAENVGKRRDVRRGEVISNSPENTRRAGVSSVCTTFGGGTPRRTVFHYAARIENRHSVPGRFDLETGRFRALDECPRFCEIGKTTLYPSSTSGGRETRALVKRESGPRVVFGGSSCFRRERKTKRSSPVRSVVIVSLKTVPPLRNEWVRSS